MAVGFSLRHGLVAFSYLTEGEKVGDVTYSELEWGSPGSFRLKLWWRSRATIVVGIHMVDRSVVIRSGVTTGCLFLAKINLLPNKIHTNKY